VSYTFERYTTFRDVFVVGDNLDGDRLAKIPEWTANSSITYQKGIPDKDATFMARIDWSYRGDMKSEPQNLDIQLIPARHVFNGRIGVTVGENWEVALWGKNIFNKLYKNESRYVGGFKSAMGKLRKTPYFRYRSFVQPLNVA